MDDRKDYLRVACCRCDTAFTCEIRLYVDDEPWIHPDCFEKCPFCGEMNKMPHGALRDLKSVPDERGARDLKFSLARSVSYPDDSL